MNKKGRRILVGCLAVALVAGLAGGGVYLAKNQQKAEVNVYSIYDVGMTEYWGDSRETSGMVTTDHIQNVYISTTQMVQEIYVQEGQNVKAGDLLLSYDTTLSTLELERKDLEIQKLELSMEEARKDLKKIQRYRPGVPVDEEDLVSGGALGGTLERSGDIGSPAAQPTVLLAGGTTAARQQMGTGIVAGGLQLMSFSGDMVGDAAGMRLMAAGLLAAPTEPSADPTEPSTDPTEPSTDPTEPSTDPTEPSEDPTEPSEDPTEPSTDPTEPSEDPTEPSTDPTEPSTDPAKPVPELVRGDGTMETPYLYLWPAELAYTPAYLEQLLGEQAEVWVVFMQRENDSIDGVWLYNWTMRLFREDGEFRFEIQPGPEEDPLLIPEDPGTVDPGTDDPLGPIGPTGPTYTSAEIAEMKAAKEREIRDIDLNIRVARVEYGKLEKELNESSVRAELDGVVRTVGDTDTAAVENQPLITVVGGEGGYYVQGTVSELDLGTVQVGQPVTVMSWMTGETAEGTIQAIGDMPSSDSYWDGVSNPNSSFYPFTVFIDGSASFENGDYLSITYTPQGTGEEGSSVYLQNPFVLTKDGQSYVYVRGADGSLERRQVAVGKSLYGSYTEIRSGLTAEDWVAFPYGRDLKEGNPTREGTMEDLYSTTGY